MEEGFAIGVGVLQNWFSDASREVMLLLHCIGLPLHCDDARHIRIAEESRRKPEVDFYNVIIFRAPGVLLVSTAHICMMLWRAGCSFFWCGSSWSEALISFRIWLELCVTTPRKYKSASSSARSRSGGLTRVMPRRGRLERPTRGLRVRMSAPCRHLIFSASGLLPLKNRWHLILFSHYLVAVLVSSFASP